MHRCTARAFLGGIVLAILLIGPVAAESSAITSISPEVGYTGSTTTVTITGTDFNTSSVTVLLMMEDESNITATITSHTCTTIVCKFTLSSSREKGAWDLVVINEDESETVATEGFTIRSPMELSSITPESATTNEDDTEFTLEGSGLADIAALYLSNAGYGSVDASLDEIDSTEVTGTFDLTDVSEGTYEVCVKDEFGTEVCGLDFEVTTDELGDIDISSSPTGTSIYVDSEYEGTTPDIVEDVITGYHKVKLVKAGYTDWEKLVKVTEGDTTTIDAELSTITLVTTQRTPDPTVATTIPTTVPTKRVTSSITVPTPWPTSTTTTQASPLDALAGIAAVVTGIGVMVIWKKQGK